MVDVHHAEVPIADQLSHVGPEVDGDAVGEGAAAGQLDTRELTHLAVRTVGGHQVVRANGLLDVTVARSDD